MIIQKQYARRNVEGFVSPYDMHFEYKCIQHLDEQALRDVLIDAMSNSLARDIVAEEGWNELKEFIEFAGGAYHPETWLVAYQEERPVGIIFAQRYDDKPEEGSLFFVGVASTYRGKGLAKVLHAKGLELLSQVGVKEYVGSRDVLNIPMIKAFESNGCRLYATRDVEIGEALV